MHPGRRSARPDPEHDMRETPSSTPVPGDAGRTTTHRPRLLRSGAAGSVMAMALTLPAACASPTVDDAVAPAARPALSPSQPGREVAGSRIRFPATVTAGKLVEGLFPVGSTVESRGERFDVDASGRVQLPAPSAPGTWVVRVHRPGHSSPFVMRVAVVSDTGP